MVAILSQFKCVKSSRCKSFEDQAHVDEIYGCLGAVSQTFRELSKIISRKYTMPEITFMMRISSWNLVHVAKAWAHMQSFSLKFTQEVWFLQYTNILLSLWNVSETPSDLHMSFRDFTTEWHGRAPGGRFKNTYELLNLRALKISKLHKNHIFQCVGKIFCVEFQKVPLKFHTKYLTHTLKDVDFIHIWKFKSS